MKSIDKISHLAIEWKKESKERKKKVKENRTHWKSMCKIKLIDLLSFHFFVLFCLFQLITTKVEKLVHINFFNEVFEARFSFRFFFCLLSVGFDGARNYFFFSLPPSPFVFYLFNFYFFFFYYFAVFCITFWWLFICLLVYFIKEKKTIGCDGSEKCDTFLLYFFSLLYYFDN